jgi:aminoglycoside phosphotransferase (APT) family kinase protein
MLVHAEAKGTRLKDLRGTIEYNHWLGPVADALADLHTTRLTHQGLSESGDDLFELAAMAKTVSALLPHLGQATTHLAQRIATALSEVQNSPGSAHTIVHGSFHDDQVLVAPDRTRVSLVDLDSIGLGHPLLDVGHFLAYLTADGAPEQAHSQFLDAYISACRARHMVVSATAARQAALFEAATLLRWCTLPFRELAPDWPIQVEHRLALATRRLAEYERHVWASVSMGTVL